ncbi:hypothetical protein [Clostridium botulinum]|uniref:hypothetical protein n=1 Tax=Clostridium botulinum TaxID=1491 RepID=UPI0004DAC52A|nr:hypothetical protein [Clostridium botulinum]KEH90448.1 hypothetical protein Z963_p0001 [Clostridium botulinum C/D str. It1]
MSKNKTNQHQEFLKMYSEFLKLPRDKQLYLSGVVSGLAAKSEINNSKIKD